MQRDISHYEKVILLNSLQMNFILLKSYGRHSFVFHGDAVDSPTELRDVLGFLCFSRPTIKFHIVGTTNVLF